MQLRNLLSVAGALLLSSCFVYDEALLQEGDESGVGGSSSNDGGSPATGGQDGSGSTGAGSTGGTSPGSGATGSGGSSGTGGSSGDGGAPGAGGDETGGTGGDTGGTNTGGNAGGTGGGSGGDPTCDWGAKANWPNDETVEVVDDFDDNDLTVEGTFAGQWNKFSGNEDGTSTLAVELFSSDPTNDVALHYVGKDFGASSTCDDCWHSFATDLNGGGPVDLSAFDGIAFWIRVDCADSTDEGQLRIAVSDEYGDDEYNKAGHSLPFLKKTWEHKKIAFDDLGRRWGDATAFDPTTATQVEFSTDINGNLDIWIDDVEFYTDP